MVPLTLLFALNILWMIILFSTYAISSGSISGFFSQYFLNLSRNVIWNFKLLSWLGNYFFFDYFLHFIMFGIREDFFNLAILYFEITHVVIFFNFMHFRRRWVNGINIILGFLYLTEILPKKVIIVCFSLNSFMIFNNFLNVFNYLFLSIFSQYWKDIINIRLLMNLKSY